MASGDEICPAWDASSADTRSTILQWLSIRILCQSLLMTVDFAGIKFLSPHPNCWLISHGIVDEIPVISCYLILWGCPVFETAGLKKKHATRTPAVFLRIVSTSVMVLFPEPYGGRFGLSSDGGPLDGGPAAGAPPGDRGSFGEHPAAEPRAEAADAHHRQLHPPRVSSEHRCWGSSQAVIWNSCLTCTLYWTYSTQYLNLRKTT